MSAIVTGRQVCENDDNGIVKWITGDEEYTFWTFADFVKDAYIIDFLKERFPGKLVARELNKIDFSIPEDNLPIEVQATPVQTANNPSYSKFEKEIEKQINQNIKSYGICWFFFDSEFLRSMKSAGKGMSINMVWFRDYMKDEKLKVFTVSHDGIIEEKHYSDFDFLSEMSQVCKLATKTDDMILNDNKLKIYACVAKMYCFTQNEIENFNSIWREYCKINKIDSDDKNDRFRDFLGKQKNKRAKLYSDILHAITNLSAINDILGLGNYDHRAKSDAFILGIFDVKGWSRNAITTFINMSNCCQYFPGYLRNKEMWNKLKGHSLNPRQFENIIKNGIGNYFWYEEDKNGVAVESDKTDSELDLVENNESTNDRQVDKDNDFNVEIKSKGQIITINIKKDETAGW